MEEYERQQYLSQDYHNVTGAASLRASTVNVEEVIEFLKSVTAENCHTFDPDDLILPGDVGFGKENQFENEARMALRLANFLSAFLQVRPYFIPPICKILLDIVNNIWHLPNPVRISSYSRMYSHCFQIVDHSEIFSGVRVVDRPLTEDQMMGEVLSIILGNSRVGYFFFTVSLLILIIENFSVKLCSGVPISNLLS